MSDIRQPKQNTQLAGAFDDISHLGGSKLQENKPVENMVHQRILHRKLMQQESRRSSQKQMSVKKSSPLSPNLVSIPRILPFSLSLIPTHHRINPVSIRTPGMHYFIILTLLQWVHLVQICRSSIGRNKTHIDPNLMTQVDGKVCISQG